MKKFLSMLPFIEGGTVSIDNKWRLVDRNKDRKIYAIKNSRPIFDIFETAKVIVFKENFNIVLESTCHGYNSKKNVNLCKKINSMYGADSSGYIYNENASINVRIQLYYFFSLAGLLVDEDADFHYSLCYYTTEHNTTLCLDNCLIFIDLKL